jgi:hypothetical protein
MAEECIFMRTVKESFLGEMTFQGTSEGLVEVSVEVSQLHVEVTWHFQGSKDSYGYCSPITLVISVRSFVHGPDHSP